ncbi:alpha/beta fold hydrolase [Streptomyces poriticola]|uniref:alpha/beta fold hydrolase n=1 Tax=Streptomyces poriticola TaxID=3120506 RepID=UPI002FCE3491
MPHSETEQQQEEERERAGSAVVDGARVAYWESGPADGEPVLLLHGYPADHHSWRHQAPALARTGHRVIAPDLLGWGRSDRPRHLPFDYDTEVARVGRLLDALGLDSANLVGHDYGGFLSLGFTQSHPERVRRLAILNSRSHSTFRPPWYAVIGLLSAAGRVPALGPLLARLPAARFHRRILLSLVRAGHLDEELLNTYVDWMRSREGRRWLGYFAGEYRVAARTGLRRRLPEITCPTAVVWGRADTYLRPAIATELAERIPHAELTMLDDAGHWVMDERPTEVTAALERLLTRDA